MYYPYLRGKQFELLALREFANESANNRNIVPIIEPVKTHSTVSKLPLKLCLSRGLSLPLY